MGGNFKEGEANCNGWRDCNGGAEGGIVRKGRQIVKGGWVGGGIVMEGHRNRWALYHLLSLIMAYIILSKEV